jgi:subtilisin
MRGRNFSFVATVAVVVGFIGTTFGQAPGDRAPDRYIVELKAGADPVEVLASHRLAAPHIYRHALNGFATQVPPGRLAALANDPRVAHISVDQQVFAFGKPGQPPPPPASGQVIPAGVTRVGAKLVSQTGAGIGVAIVDTGLDFNHLDLPVSKVSGASFVSPDFTYTTSAQDDAGHGTHVGGIVAALNNTIDVVGVAPGATLYAVKVLDNTGSGSDSSVISGLDWVVAANKDLVSPLSPQIRVINMSLGRGASADDSAMHTAIQNVVAAGISVVVAAGNDANAVVSQMVPAGFPEVIAVASTTAKTGTSNNKRAAAIAADTASFFTTDGKFNADTGVGVAISAPGEEQENVQFPYINSLGILSTALGGGTTRMSGTSMAAPHAAGVVALLLEKSLSLSLTLAPADVKALIMVGDKEGLAPLNSPTSSYTFDGEREGILYAPVVLGNFF